jgi:hypothetical protein
MYLCNRLRRDTGLACLLKAARIILKSQNVPGSDRQLIVFSMIALTAAAFNRDWQREGILNARFEKLFDLNAAALF